MANPPFFPVVHCKKDSHRQEEGSESIPSLGSFFHRKTSPSSIILQDFQTLCSVRILQYEPILRGLAIVFTVNPPALLKDEIVLKVSEQVKGWHRPAGKEMLGHPAVFGDEIIRDTLVAEYVNK